jgi:hypothetical protein
MVLLLLTALFKVKLKREVLQQTKSVIILALFFLYYIVFVNMSWSFILSHGLFLNTVFYVYNIAVFIAMVIVISNNPPYFLRIIFHGTLISVFLQFLLSFLASGGIRATVFFNNPNQLGFYALLMLSIAFVVLKSQEKPKNIVLFSFILAGFYLSFISLSKAAIVGCVLLIGLFTLYSKIRLWLKTLIFFMFASLGYGIYQAFYNPISLYGKFALLDTFLYRVHKDDGSGLFDDRGYDRIANHPEYLVFGAGEGDYTRFDTFAPIELHSTFGNILFSYGIVGLTIFLVFLLVVIYKSKISLAYPLLPVFTYGLTHNGIRNSLLWILFALLIVMGNSQRRLSEQTGVYSTNEVR